MLFMIFKKGVQFGINKFGWVLIGDEMGVGKTIQALALAAIYQQSWPLLIICPSSLKYTWQDEILNWLNYIEEKDI